MEAAVEKQSAAPAPAVPAAVDDDDDEVVCRYCFEGASDELGELISPCACSGGQKWVHLSCLRRWQRMVLVSQPTHPDTYGRDPRHYTCNVCKAPFTCAPPERIELMTSFTGPELGALIATGCVIGAHEAFSLELERSMEQMPADMVEESSYRCWARGVYLITKVEPLEARLQLPVSSLNMLQSIRVRVGPQLTMRMGRQSLRLVPGGIFEGLSSEELYGALEQLCADEESLRDESLCAPADSGGSNGGRQGPGSVFRGGGATLVFEQVPAPSFGDDHVTAVNIARCVRAAHPAADAADGLSRQQASVVDAAYGLVCRQYRSAARVRVEHYIGGPCNPSSLACCIVSGGVGRGWTVIDGDDADHLKLSRAITLAFSRACVRCEAQLPVRGGQPVRIHGLRARSDLNGQIARALRFVSASSRWEVRLGNGDGVSLRPANLEPQLPPEAAAVGDPAVGTPAVGAPAVGAAEWAGLVLSFWGDAQWSRVQLLGELARGHWGLCTASVSDLIVEPSGRRGALDGRLQYAPATDMTEDFIRRASVQMQAERERNALAQVDAPEAREDDVEAELLGAEG